MKLNLTISILFLLLITGIGKNYPQENKNQQQFQTDVSGVGTSAATFLEIGAGGRAMGIGGAYAAVANDASALYWNPAGIVWAGQKQIEFMHNNWLVGTNYDFVGAVVPIPSLNSALGISFISFATDDQPVRTVDRPEGTGQVYNSMDYAVGLTYSVALTDRFSFGFTGKYINQRIWNESGSAAAMDIGIFYNTNVEGLRLGFSICNFGTTIALQGNDLATTVDPDKTIVNFDKAPASYRTDSSPLPLLFRAGIAYETKLGNFGKILCACDLNHPSNAPESVNTGVEYGFADMFFLRAGYQSLFEKDAINGLTLGAGIDYYNNEMNFGVRFDYAWADWGVLEKAQRFSVSLVF